MWCDVAVVGAGPAGLAAAVTAARAGCRVALLDSAPQLGGQFWHHHEEWDGRPERGQRAWSVFASLRAELVQLGVEFAAGAPVWFAEPLPSGNVAAGEVPAGPAPSGGGRPGGFRLQVEGREPVTAARVVFATGAHDRPLPFPGWDLPGVVTPGAAQALRVGSGVAIGSRVVVAGAGPFLLPVAAGLLADGVDVAGVYEAGHPARYARRPGAVASKLYEAAGYATTLARHRVPYRIHHAVVAARGTTAVSGVDVARLDRHGRMVPGSTRQVACDAVAVGFGFTPRLELPLALGCATKSDVDGSLVLAADVAGRTSVPGVYAAGEVTGVGGHDLALTEGHLVGAVVARAAGRVSPFNELELSRLLDRRARQIRFARLMHRAHPPPAGWVSWLEDSTVVCRCEEVTVGQIRTAVTEWGATDARTVKNLCRPGMGWCQGRVCGYATASLTAHLTGRALTSADLRAFAHRPIATPVPLSELAGPPPRETG